MHDDGAPHNEFDETQLNSISPVPFDADEFRPFLKDMELTEEQETELLQSLWFIIKAMAEIGFKGDPVSLIFGELANEENLKE